MTMWIRTGAAIVAAVAIAAVTVGGCSGSDPSPEPAADPAGEPERGEVSTVDRIRSVSYVPAERGRFRLRIELGVVGVQVLDTEIEGAFDELGGYEMTLDLRDYAASLPSGAEVRRPDGLGDLMPIRVVDGKLLVHVGANGRDWAMFPGTVDQALPGVVAHQPDELLALLAGSGPHTTLDDGLVIDGVETTRHSGWIDPALLVALSPTATGTVEAIAQVAPPELVDRLVRFDLWVDDERRPRRLVVELDLDVVAEVARLVDGTTQGVERLRMRYVVDWFDLDAPVRIEMPPPSELSVIDVEALTRPGDSP